jgi:hypothetical protein
MGLSLFIRLLVGYYQRNRRHFHIFLLIIPDFCNSACWQHGRIQFHYIVYCANSAILETELARFMLKVEGLSSENYGDGSKAVSVNRFCYIVRPPNIL